MAAVRRYDETLRAIGQKLEAKDISVFDLNHRGSVYVISPNEKDTQPQVIKWLTHLRSGSATDPLILGVADVQQLSEAGRAMRSSPGHITNFRSISNLLRTIGAYLDSSEFELLSLHKRQISVTLSYRDKAGQEQKEDRPISSFYRLFLDLCGKRIRNQ